MNKRKKIVAASIVAVGILAGGGFVAVQAATPGSTNCKTLSYPLCSNSVGEPQLVPALRAKVNKPAPVDTDAYGKAGVTKTCPAVAIAHFGGSFKTGKTLVCTFTLPKGTWLLNSNAFFARTTAGVAGTRPQLALRVGATETAFGDDYGTILGAEISPTANRELAASTVKLVTTTGPTVVDVFAFGYNDDTGTAGSGDVTAAATIAAVLVG